MSNFYLKIKKFDNEIEFSTENEEIFNAKIQEILKDFAENSLYKNTLKEEIVEKTEEIQETIHPGLCDFIDIQKPQESINEIQNNKNNDLNTQEFSEVLEKAQQNPTINFNEPENTNAELSTFLTSQNPQNQLDYLIFTAQFLLKYLNIQTFTLKQINSKLVPATQIAISHKTLSEAEELGYISLLPDLTETTIAKEYSLTQRGENEYKQ